MFFSESHMTRYFATPLQYIVPKIIKALIACRSFHVIVAGRHCRLIAIKSLELYTFFFFFNE